ncbi:translation initiation factor IF-2-like [Eriocheir sinensis]|uniref:translation initiation factor IF-2-like n=1 Tax=Eriocheir sinensis TaxID=95602 RepID=UPI0021C5680B|nr:translation initiation factor IF-2-like [Eriocheir sinensis]
MDPQPKRQRKANWGDDESLQLAMLYRDEVHVLKRNFKTVGVSNQKKHDVWTKITADLNGQFHHERTAVEVKKRWFTITSKSRMKLKNFRDHRNGTGGALHPSLDPIDELVRDVLGQDSPVITGFEEIDDLGHQRTVDIEDAAEPASQLIVGQGDAEAPTVIIVPEPTLQPQTEGGAWGKVPAEDDAAAAQAKVAAAEEEAVASRATAAAAQAGEEAARAMKAAAEEVAACARAFTGAARAQEAVARAQEAAERAREAAAKEKAEAMRLKQILLKLQIEKERKNK